MDRTSNSTADVARAVGITGLLGVGLIHRLDVVGKIQETPYIGWMYIALILGSVAVAGALLVKPSRLAWGAAGALAASALGGFLLSRTTGLPNATGDIGNRSEPLGLASLFVETLLVALSGYALATVAAVRAIPQRRSGAGRSPRVLATDRAA